MTRTDLHIHTTASDGTWEPQELINQLQKRKIEVFAVTDHDTVSNVDNILRLADNEQLSCIPGVEISTTSNGQTFHILGYGVEITHKGLHNLLKTNTELMEEADDISVRKLIEHGVNIDLDEYLAYEFNRTHGGWKSLDFLLYKGLCKDINDFFARFFTADKGITFPTFPLPQAVITTIHEAQGIAILAHPGSQFHCDSLEETLNTFSRLEIQGVECYHPGHSQEITEKIIKWCRKRQMLITGGSDCHGIFLSDRCLGEPFIELKQLELGMLKKYIKKIHSR